MKKRFSIVMLAAACLALAPASASAWGIMVRVVCDGNGLPVLGATVTVKGVAGTVFTTSGVTNDNGAISIYVLDVPASYEVTLTAPNGAAVVSPVPHPYPISLDPSETWKRIDFRVSDAACSGPSEPKCWLTGGGAKFSTITGTPVAEKGPQHSFGGNVNPGCNTDSGEGGQWNHVAHSLKMHFQGFQIQVVRCGNVSGIPPGSTSPVTPFNFIEFEGTGVLKGIAGSKMPTADVYFWARAEDRNEPGSSGAKDGAKIDRYFLHVYDGSGTRLLIDLDGDPQTVDPVTITDGNLQIHISSCSTP
jgi:hypothetical protein